MQITSCSDLTNSSCEIFADGGASVQNVTQLTDSSYSVRVQVRSMASLTATHTYT